MTEEKNIRAKAEKLTEEQLNARLKHIIMKREQGLSYEQIGRGLEKAGFGHNVTKVRIEAIIKLERPDLMGSVAYRRYGRRE